MTNAFLKIFGNSSPMKTLDYLLDQQIDVSVADVCRGTSLSRKTVDNTLSSLVNGGIIKKTRIIGKTQMFKIDKKNIISKKLYEINNIILKQQENLLRGKK